MHAIQTPNANQVQFNDVQFLKVLFSSGKKKREHIIRAGFATYYNYTSHVHVTISSTGRHVLKHMLMHTHTAYIVVHYVMCARVYSRLHTLQRRQH